MNFFRTIDTPLNNLPRRQRRTYEEALRILAPLKLRGTDLANAEARIHSARQPKAEARRIARFHERENAKRTIPIDEEVQFSDVQELRVKLIRRYGVVYPSDPHAFTLRRMEQEIASGTMTKKRFKALTAEIMKFEFSRGQLKQRKAEANLQRNRGEW